ncbi:BMP family lipoprotein [Polyangium aurulentum]|uniref:BMP family lipoprotein n=1 Tax=Polyangium aurulentum TaxID=2567896 RepID=UPI0010AE63D1|nr:BMP family ABC transporter substrate-binding protein [Polyangium aurulentum]UQA58813.1 BMP family ABC transporter substrate-binding protein [Polyangium aurulentum]
MHKLALGLAAVATIAGLAGCKGSSDKPAGDSAGGVKIGLITDVGGRGDQSFNDGALRGLEMWAAGKKYTAGGYQPLPDAERVASIPATLKDVSITPLAVTPVVLTSKAQEDYEPNLDLLVGEKVDLAIGVGFMIENAVEAAAKKHPQTRFLLVDSPLLDPQNKPFTLPNVKTVVFQEHEGSFLVGALAGLASKSGKIGFVGGMGMPLIKKFEAGFVAGIKAVNPQAADATKRVYTGNFDDSASGKRAALDLYNQGIDVVYHAAGAGGLGVIQAAKEQNKLAIGVDSDQAHLAPANVLTSMTKHVDYAIYTTVKSVVDKKFQAGDSALGLKEGGVGMAPVTVDFPNKQEALAKVEKLRKAVIEGKIKVPSTLEELATFAPPPIE